MLYGTLWVEVVVGRMRGSQHVIAAVLSLSEGVSLTQLIFEMLLQYLIPSSHDEKVARFLNGLSQTIPIIAMISLPSCNLLLLHCDHAAMSQALLEVQRHL